MNSMVDHQSDLRDLITLTPEEIAEANAWFDEVALQAKASEQQNTAN